MKRPERRDWTSWFYYLNQARGSNNHDRVLDKTEVEIEKSDTCVSIVIPTWHNFYLRPRSHSNVGWLAILGIVEGWYSMVKVEVRGDSSK